MGERLSLFSWWVPTDGVRFVDGGAVFDANHGNWKSAKGGLLVVNGRDGYRYDPTTKKGAPLFEVLARLDTDGTSLERFATEWGFLDASEDSELTSATGEPSTGAMIWSQRAAPWRRSILELREAFELWSAIESLTDSKRRRGTQETADAQAILEQRVQRNRDGPTIYHADQYRESLRIDDPDNETHELLAKGDLLLTSKLALQKLVNRRLTRLTSLKLVFDPTDSKLKRRAVPVSLLGAAWDQFAEAVEGKRSPRRCPRCRDWFVIKSSRRGHDIYCSDKCRVSMHLKRQKARSLASEGRRVASISKDIGVDPDLVRSWISKK